jgi:hypothetical protein
MENLGVFRRDTLNSLPFSVAIGTGVLVKKMQMKDVAFLVVSRIRIFSLLFIISFNKIIIMKHFIKRLLVGLISILLFGNLFGQTVPHIISKNKIRYNNKELTFVQIMLDSANSIKGKVYVELINGSIFKRLYILDGTKLTYFVGDGVSTNFIDTERFVPEYFGLKIENRNQHSIVLGIVNPKGQPWSDAWQIVYSETEKRFDIPPPDPNE